MGRMLERPPLDGPLGALVDLARVIVGTDVLSAFSQGAYASLPPVGQLLLQCALVGLVWKPADVCQTTMLQAPLAQQRLASVAAALETIALCLMSPMRAESNTLRLLMSRHADPQQVCVAVISFSQLAIGLLPVVLAAHGWEPGPEGQAQQCGRGAAVRQPLTAAQRKEIGGLLPGLMVHTCSWLLLGANPALPHNAWRQAELLLVVAVALVEIGMLWRWPALSQPPLCTPRRILFRLAFLSSPAFRRMGVGMGRMLERPPLGGPLGALVDLVRLIVGTNILTAFSQGTYASMAPVGQLLLQCVLVRLVWKPDDICNATMLQAPLAQQWLASVAAALETAAICLMSPVRADSRVLLLLMSRRADPQQVCVAVISFGQLAIGLLPVVLAAHGWRPGPEGQAQQCGRWRRAWRRSNLLLQRCSSVRPGLGGFLLRAWLFAAVLWIGCRLNAGLT
ncbi:hypothetical protein C2E21_6801 [Chlorella sorokiniana]|uniref:Uncharacterized protein n=1 Tax=Chlorella sorokiniana TaxID=3076 RepID=A0A2P6TKE4_CHLSO|nr:hypothetical protein C2E21_6801 [Chlorella sorokiniana]|eukprot:PRW44550.1 hypothetical protein C2E21_6801 [Chlorella sorokiniana]